MSLKNSNDNIGNPTRDLPVAFIYATILKDMKVSAIPVHEI